MDSRDDPLHIHGTAQVPQVAGPLCVVALEEPDIESASRPGLEFSGGGSTRVEYDRGVHVNVCSSVQQVRLTELNIVVILGG